MLFGEHPLWGFGVNIRLRNQVLRVHDPRTSHGHGIFIGAR